MPLPPEGVPGLPALQLRHPPGRCKGITHTHDSLAMQAVLSANHLQFRPDDVLVQALPLVHLYPGNIIMGGLFVAGAAIVVQPVFHPPGFAALLFAVPCDRLRRGAHHVRAALPGTRAAGHLPGPAPAGGRFQRRSPLARQYP